MALDAVSLVIFCSRDRNRDRDRLDQKPDHLRQDKPRARLEGAVFDPGTRAVDAADPAT
jgi:hypothetical protein